MELSDEYKASLESYNSSRSSKTSIDEQADIIANAISYTHLRERHIDKEDRVVYTFAERNLKENILDEINSECLKFEDNNETVKNKYLEVLSKLEDKYIM